MTNRTKMIRDWVLLALMVVMILTTLGLVRRVVNFVYRLELGWTLKYGSVALLAAIGLAVIGYLVFIAKAKSVRTYFALAGLALLYGLILIKLSKQPVEQIHLVEYGIVGLLAHRALGHHSKEPGCTLLAVFVTLNIGLFDELIQGLLPSRIYDTRDVLTNAAAGLLGVLVAAVIRGASINKAENQAVSN